VDKQLQQRLLGAAVIVAVVVIFVPELVKTPQDRLPEPITPEGISPRAEPIIQRQGDELIIGMPRPLEEVIPTVPDAIEDDESVVFIEEPPMPLIEVPAETTSSAPESVVGSAPAVPADPTPSLVEVPPPAELPPPVPPEPPAPPVRREPPPPPRQTARVEPTPPPVETELPELRLISRPMAEYQAQARADSPEPAEQPRWVVQAGSFESAANAGQLRDRLREQRFPVTLSQATIDGRVLYRVQIGPHSSRAEGERMRDRLQRETGIEGSLIPVYN